MEKALIEHWKGAKPWHQSLSDNDTVKRNQYFELGKKINKTLDLKM